MSLISNAGTAALNLDTDTIQITLQGKTATIAKGDAFALLSRNARSTIQVRDEQGDHAGWLQSVRGDGITLSIFETAATYSLTKGRLSDLLCGAVDSIGLSGWSVPA